MLAHQDHSTLALDRVRGQLGVQQNVGQDVHCLRDVLLEHLGERQTKHDEQQAQIDS
jgi:hypothetical protein